MGRRSPRPAALWPHVRANLQFQHRQQLHIVVGQWEHGNRQRDGPHLAALRKRAVVDGVKLLWHRDHQCVGGSRERRACGLALAQCERTGVHGGATLCRARRRWRGVPNVDDQKVTAGALGNAAPSTAGAAQRRSTIDSSSFTLGKRQPVGAPLTAAAQALVVAVPEQLEPVHVCPLAQRCQMRPVVLSVNVLPLPDHEVKLLTMFELQVCADAIPNSSVPTNATAHCFNEKCGIEGITNPKLFSVQATAHAARQSNRGVGTPCPR